ncbi:hypothetical protein C8A00DRAFT_31372 [Chaetomidium leptoderma]|uniref:Uncharacterized protein n=1 Tax=Chaetomidium leptoderma TaxID=669021 RepID=A0AAN6VQA0_9PEZI|nr:hypothetical protein C8A00DRAFT_31372 [Chaetomidium leptoderma]
MSWKASIFGGLLLAAHHVAAQASVTSTQTIVLPTARPLSAFNVPADFASVGFETAFLPGYNNTLSENLVASLASRMAALPVIRIGGTSGDRITFKPKQKEPAHCVKKPCNSAATFILGPTYFDALSTRFKSAHFSIQAPLSDGLPTAPTSSPTSRVCL